MAGIWNGLQMPMYLNTCSTAGGYVSEGHGTWLVKMSQRGTGPALALPSAFYSGHHMTNSSQRPASWNLPTVTDSSHSPSEVILSDCTRYLEWRGAADPEHWYWEMRLILWQTWPCSSSISRTDWWGGWWEHLKQKVIDVRECCQRA